MAIGVGWGIIAMSDPRFLGVERSALPRLARPAGARQPDRAALVRLSLPELLARVLAGRGVTPGDAEAFLDPP
jgi:hypothetical protein